MLDEPTALRGLDLAAGHDLAFVRSLRGRRGDHPSVHTESWDAARRSRLVTVCPILIRSLALSIEGPGAALAVTAVPMATCGNEQVAGRESHPLTIQVFHCAHKTARQSLPRSTAQLWRGASAGPFSLVVGVTLVQE